MTDSFELYIKGLWEEYKTGKATEHSYRPALKQFVESLKKGVNATNEPKQVECGAPDFIVQKKQIPLGYIECKDIHQSLDSVEDTDQLKRYRASLNNLILTNYLEFRYYVQGERRMTVPIARIDSKGKLNKIAGCESNLMMMFDSFFAFSGPSISKPKDLAERMAKLAQLIKETIKTAFKLEPDKGKLHRQFKGFRDVLLDSLSEEQFADMYAQTICYGLFAARCNVTGKAAENFTREHAAYELPKTNPFLREVFNQIAGPDLDESITWVVDDLAELLRRADIAGILADFGKATMKEDPVVHFYETFLSQYDPKMRESRGVYYTPEPVVSYIVRSIDHILKTDFGLKDGLADATKIKHKFENPETHEKEERTVHKVQILDPAVGTGTFLYGVINQIFEKFKNNKGMWSSYVSNHLLPRLYGFELLMAPYAVAHMKLGLLLKETGYDFKAEERLRVYLTNTLEEAHDFSQEAFANLIAEEANRASEVKKDVPIMVILGNPPYSKSSQNRGDYINDLMELYKTSVKDEQNIQPLSNDYVKFLRYSQDRIERTGFGIVAMITKNSYLASLIFRGMREELARTFNKIYILDLHGSSLIGELKADGKPDENVFDIRQGVVISILVKQQKSKINNVFYSEIYGTRHEKYKYLLDNCISETNWQKVQLKSPSYFYTPSSNLHEEEYYKTHSLMKIFGSGSLKSDRGINWACGIKTNRDNFLIDFSLATIEDRFNSFTDVKISDADIKLSYSLIDNEYWNTKRERQKVREVNWKESIYKYSYRPFDTRVILYQTNLIEIGRGGASKFLMYNLLRKGNIALTTTRQLSKLPYYHAFISNNISDMCFLSSSTKECSYIFPLYLYPNPKDNGDLFSNGYAQHVNINQDFIRECTEKLGLTYKQIVSGNLRKSLTPQDIFHYIYAILHSPTYRSRYAEFLKIDFPRIPLTSDVDLFRKLCTFGEELVGLHLLEKVPSPFTNYPVKGDDVVENPRYVEPLKGSDSHVGRVCINKAQYFENIPAEVWEFHVGGYQVCQKWLKDRKGRKLSYDDINHYRNIVVALHETIRIMGEIDNAIPKWPIE